MSEKRVPKERIQLYLRPEICAWLASQPEGRNVPAGEALESWIIEKEYPTVRDRYCRGLSDAQILKLDRSEIAEMAEDDDIPLVWMILQGGARRAVEAEGNKPRVIGSPEMETIGQAEMEMIGMLPVVIDPEMGPGEWMLRAGLKKVQWPGSMIMFRGSVPEIPETSPAAASAPVMVSSPYGEVEFTAENALALFEAYLNGGDELGYVAEKDVIAAIKFLRAKLLAK